MSSPETPGWDETRDAIEADIHTALESMYGSEGAADLLGDFAAAVERATREKIAEEIRAAAERQLDIYEAGDRWYALADDVADFVAAGPAS